MRHLIVFALVASLFVEFVNVRSGMDAAAVRRIVAIDVCYGMLAGLIVLVGFSRAIFAAKGWHYYWHDLFFWAEIGAFVVIGLVSMPLSVSYRK